MPILVVVAAAIVGAVLAQVIASKQARNVLSGVVAHATVWAGYAMTQVVAPLAGVFVQAVLDAWETTQSTFGSVVGKLMREVTGREVPAEILSTGKSTESLLAFGRALGEEVGPLVTAALAPDGALDPDDAPRRLNQLMGVAAGFALDDWWDHTVIELASVGQIGGMAELSNAVASGMGITALGKQAMRQLLRATLAEPLQTWANRTYTPTQLTTTQIIDAYQQGLLSDADTAALLRDRGYTYDLGILLLNLSQKDFTLDQAAQLLQLGRIDEGKFQEIVRRQGYGADRAALVGDLVRGKRSLGLLEEIADQARALYRSGQLEVGELQQVLGEAGYRAEEVELVLVREELARREARQLTSGQILDAYQQGTFDEAQTRGALRRLRYEDATIDVLLALQRRQLTPAEILTVYTAGRLDRTEALRRLVARGYDQEEAGLLLDLRARTLSEGQVIDALRRGLLLRAQAFEKLRALGYDQETADLLVALASAQLTTGDVQGALLRGLIDPGQAREKLRALGYEEPDVELLMALRFRLLTRGEIVDAYDVGRITRTDAQGRLVELGLEGPDASLVLDVIDRRRSSTPPTA